jgi:uncharacterized protein involved in cysteine biosynthesis
MARARATAETVKVARPKATRATRGAARPKQYTLERRYQQRVRHIELWSVLKISVCFYLCALVVLLGAGIVLWFIASAANVIDNVESFMDDLGFENFQFLSWRILRASILVGLVVVALSTIVTVLAAAFYNLFAELVGGVEITVVDEDPVR